MDERYLLNVRFMFERILSDTRSILVNLERRYNIFSQQQTIFIQALDRCRQEHFEPHKPVRTIAQVVYYSDNVATHRTDTRILKMFLLLCNDFNEFRRTLQKLAAQSSKDATLSYIFATWKRVLDHRQDLTQLRARFPSSHLHHLTFDEAHNHFGGIVSALPVAMDCAQSAMKRIEKTKAYRALADPRNVELTEERLPKRSRSGLDQSRRKDRKAPEFPRNGRPNRPANRADDALSLPVSSPLVSPDASVMSFDSVKDARFHQKCADGHISPTNDGCRVRNDPPFKRLPHTHSFGNPPNSPGGGQRTHIPARTYSYGCVQRAPPGAASMTDARSAAFGQQEMSTQTPRELKCTLDPVLAWPKRTPSVSEMRRMLKMQRPHITRPHWK